MTNADNMFYSLGYEKDYEDNESENGDMLLEYANKRDNLSIAFYSDKTFDKQLLKGCLIFNEHITLQELKAINEKVKELGWLE